ncbi:hypothetical protein D4R20_00115 [bacterium]|nr:MAG: hypothetical protein D4R20_00115 [bacterium]
MFLSEYGIAKSKIPNKKKVINVAIFKIRMMKIIFVLTLIVFGHCFCLAQDCIYKKDNSIQKGKILEVTVDRIKYKKLEIPKGPTFEIPLTEVIKIQYFNGYVDYIDTIQRKKDKGSEIKNTGWYNQTDTSKFSILYIVFNDGQDESQRFPIYFNNKYIVTLRNHTRLTYKIFSNGYLSIERRLENKVGPSKNFFIKNGQKYGIRIEEPYQWGLDPNKRFRITIVEGTQEVKSFISNEFYGFVPFKKFDLYMIENIKDPILSLW